ncbi:MAG: TM2 domain-containing protein [Pseudomonadota bacterium]
MAFGKRGVQQTIAPRPVAAVAAPIGGQVDDEPETKRGLFGGGDGDDFDINLGFLQPYGEGKSVIVLILMWFLLGGAGAHRFYLGHNTIGAAILLVNILFAICLAVTLFTGIVGVFRPDNAVQPMWIWWLVAGLTLGLWILIDGIYVICRTLSARIR